ncbi:MAG: CPBP family intramembrane glutamic endopeptidase, partial [Acidimicrobiales bacterium]
IQQLAWFGWPFVVSKWKGLGPAADWGWSFKPVDIGIGAGTAMIGMTLAGAAGALTGALVGLQDEALAENTRIITDLQGSPWLWGLLFVVVIGAPLSEEMLFRGLVLRSIEKRLGTVAGVIGSVVLFTAIHPADGGYFSSGQLVLWAAIGALALVLTMAAVMTERLAASMIAHVIINALASLRALGHFDGLLDVPT